MKDIRLIVSLSAALVFGAGFGACVSCSSDGPGGRTGTGARGDAGGATGLGGVTGGGGSGQTGGAARSGGVSGTGGADPSGGETGSGGVTGTGGVGQTGGAGAGQTGGTSGAAGAASGGHGGVGVGGSAGAGAGGGAPGSSTPCGVLAAAGNACVAAHSTVRVLYPGYTGPLYQLCKGSASPGPKSCPGANTKDIGSIASGYADAAAHETFCAGGTCTISTIYDQSPMKNHLKPGPSGGGKPSPDNPANANDLKITMNGHTVYGVAVKTGVGYRVGCSACATVSANGTATGDQAETMYMITSQKGLVSGCCFDYGNAETTSRADGPGTMEALYFGDGVKWGTGSPGGRNNGPWVMADLEAGLFAGWENNQDQNISTNTPLKYDFVTAILVGDTSDKNGGKGRFALYGADASAAPLKTLYDGIRPTKTGYAPMKKQGAIVLGIGGDNGAYGAGQWFEGVMASGAATEATVNAIQANIVAAGYGK